MKILIRIVVLVVCALSLTQCVTRSKYTQLETELHDTRLILAENKKRADDLESTVEVSNLNLNKLQKDKEAFEQKCNEMLTAKESLAEEKETYRELAESLKKEVAAGEITISQMKDRLTVNMVDKILFDSGEVTVKPSGQTTLAKIAAVLKDVNDKQIQVNGHTDNVPISTKLAKTFPTNWELSTSRATAVVRYLAEQKVPQENLVAAGYSMYRPVSKNDTEKGRQENRRIEIVLVPRPLAAK